jgi:hypothetical protein
MMAGYVFDPDTVAHDEAAGWRAYYDRDWLLMLRHMLHLCRTQFHMPLPAAIVSGYYLVQASRYWIPSRTQPEKTRYFLTRFYRQARAHSGLTFDPVRAGVLELGYWDIARRIKQGASREEYVERMTDLHSEIFGITPEQAAESAELRVQANELVNEITQGTAVDPERNWIELEERLRQCYRSVLRAQQSAPVASTA